MMTVEMVDAVPLKPWKRMAEVTMVEEVKKT
jgi:hypothetical protein